MPTAVVTSASSSIGHAFAQILVNEIGDNIKSLGCQTLQLDVCSQDSVQHVAEHLKDREIDILLNIPGVISKHQDSLEHISQSVLERTFAINTYGPLLLTQALLPNLLRSTKPRLGFMSSRVGSITDISSGGMYAYRASKAALNSICKSLSMDLKDRGVLVVIMHPGYVKTGLDPTTHSLEEAVEPEEAASKLWKVLMDKTVEDTGKFWHHEGQELPWWRSLIWIAKCIKRPGAGNGTSTGKKSR